MKRSKMLNQNAIIDVNLLFIFKRTKNTKKKFETIINIYEDEWYLKIPVLNKIIVSIYFFCCILFFFFPFYSNPKIHNSCFLNKESRMFKS